MAPIDKVPSPGDSSMSPTTPQDKLKAEARAYALSSPGNKRKQSGGGTPASSASKALKFGVGTTPSSSSKSKQQQQGPSTPNENLLGALSASSTSNNTPLAFRNATSLGDEEDDDYLRFVRSLGIDDALFAAAAEDDEDYQLDPEEDDDEEEEDDDDDPENQWSSSPLKQHQQGVGDDSSDTPSLSSPLNTTSPLHLPDLDANHDYFGQDLEEELGSLLEEDLEAAVATLLTNKKPSVAPPSSSMTPSNHSTSTTPSPSASIDSKATPTPAHAATATAAANKSKGKQQASPATPLRDAARHRQTPVTSQQLKQLRRLMSQHYQILLQQAILSVRAAQSQKMNRERSEFLSGETADDLAEILDGAVGMLQDLDQNRKDAIRNSIQLDDSDGDRVAGNGEATKPTGRRSLLSQFNQDSDKPSHQSTAKRLTRSAFSKTLESSQKGVGFRTGFDIPGLANLKGTFSTIDNSVASVIKADKTITNILEIPTSSEACRTVLRQAGANVDEQWIPGARDLSENFCDPTEYLGKNFQPPCSENQNAYVRRSKQLFTSGEDNLVLRGVNLYGEKQWVLIADRYLPDRSVNVISQRYSKICVMLYKAQGIEIDEKGNLKEPPKLESVDDIDEDKVKELGLKRVDPPAILNVHRWSLEEDLTLLKAVPIMGHMWAELGARLIPHRDRGHLRKRYQVLDRRVKATIARAAKSEKQQQQLAARGKPWVQPVRKVPVPVKHAVKTSPKKATVRSPPKPVVALKDPPMTTNEAAAAIAFLRQPISGQGAPGKGVAPASKQSLSPPLPKLAAPSAAPTAAPKPSNLDPKVVATNNGAAPTAAPSRPPTVAKQSQPPTKALPAVKPAPKRIVPTKVQGLNSKPAMQSVSTSKADPQNSLTKTNTGSNVNVLKPKHTATSSVAQRAAPFASPAKASTRARDNELMKSPPPRLPLKKTPLKTNTPKPYESHLNTDQNTRVALDKMLNEDSQMRDIGKYLNDSDSLDAAELMSQLSKPGMDHSKLGLSLNGDSVSGLSMLKDDNTKQTTSSKLPSMKLMESVLERSSGSSEENAMGATKTPTKSATMTAPLNASHGFESPAKKSNPAKAFQLDTPMMTPKGKRTGFYTHDGTPIGLDPTFRPDQSLLSPNHAGTVLDYNMDNDNSNQFVYVDLNVEDNSRQEQIPKEDPTPPPLTPSKNSAMFGGEGTATAASDHLEAAASIFALLQSPSKAETSNTPEEKKKATGQPKTLFSAAVGRVQEKETSGKKKCI